MQDEIKLPVSATYRIVDGRVEEVSREVEAISCDTVSRFFHHIKKLIGRKE